MAVVAVFSALSFNISTLSSAQAATTLDYSNLCPGDSPSTFQNLLGASLSNQPLVASPNGHCVKLSVNGGQRQSYGVAKSGDLVTLYGIGGWKTNRAVQIWLSDALPQRPASATLRHQWPLTNVQIGPDTDIHRECRTVIKGNQANPLLTYATPQNDNGDQRAFDPVNLLAPEVAEPTIFNIRVSIPNPPCTALSNAAPEEQATDVVLLVTPVIQTCVQKSTACISVSPQVVYPGQAFTVTGLNLPADQNQLFIGLPGSSTCQPLGTLDNTGQASLSAPPFQNLPLTSQTNGIYPFKVYDGACGNATGQNLYVAPPTLSAPTQLIAGSSGNITGTSWIGGAASSASSVPLQIVAFVGSQSSFNCTSAKELTLAGGTSPDGSFSLNYTAPDVSKTTNDVIRVAAIPAGAAASSACQAFDDSTCQSATPGTNCPLIAATSPIQIVTKATTPINWVYILLPLALLLLLLPLFFWLGRRDEDEIIITEQDVSTERDVVDATGSQRLAGSTYARTIRVTRERVRIRDGKVLDEEVEEYDIYRDAQGREVRRLRSPGAPTTTTTPPASGTTPATQV
jgi:hypothetical protein